MGEQAELEATAIRPPSPSVVPTAVGATVASAASSAPSLTTASPLEAFYFEEFTRTRLFVRIVWAFSVVVLAAMPLVDGDPLVKKVLAASVLVNAGFASWLWLDLRDATRFSTAKVTAFCVSCALTGFVAVVFWGVFSAAPALVVLGVFYFGRSYSKTAALVNYLVAAVTQGAWSVLVIADVVRDRGLFDGRGRPALEQVTAQLMVQGVYLLAFLSSRSSRQATLDVLERLESAVRAAQQREALLEEARQELDRALLAPGEGRYTDQVVGSFRLREVLGRGGMGEVYAATHVTTGDEAAVKLLHGHLDEDAEHIARFLREARAVSALASPHVVRVLEVSDAGARPLHLAMERLRGDTLAARLRDERRLDPKELVRMLRQVGSVVDMARAKGIVHRDLKPQNLFFAQPTANERDPRWKVLDFGVSSLGNTGTLTAGQVLGTPGYMAPEQARGEAVDGQADLYALGVITYRALTGRPAFSGKDTPSILYDVVFNMPPRPSTVADLPAAVDDVLAVAMAKRAEDRFASGAELASALESALEGRITPELERRARALAAATPWGS